MVTEFLPPLRFTTLEYVMCGSGVVAVRYTDDWLQLIALSSEVLIYNLASHRKQFKLVYFHSVLYLPYVNVFICTLIFALNLWTLTFQSTLINTCSPSLASICSQWCRGIPSAVWPQHSSHCWCLELHHNLRQIIKVRWEKLTFDKVSPGNFFCTHANTVLLSLLMCSLFSSVKSSSTS